MNTVSDDCVARGHHKFSGVRSNLSQDLRRYLTKSPENLALGDNLKTRLSAFLRPELQCLLLHRIAHYLHVNGWRLLGVLVSRFNFLLHKVAITPPSCIGPGCRLPHPATVSFHGRAGRDLTLFSQAVCCPRDALSDGPVDTGPQLGDRVTVGGHAVIIGPVTVGGDVKVAYSVRLDRDAPAGVLVVSAVNRVRMRPAVDTASDMPSLGRPGRSHDPPAARDANSEAPSKHARFCGHSDV